MVACIDAIDAKVFTNRLWHQLTQRLTDFFDHPLSRPYRVDVFDRFVRDFESKLNQLKLVEMGVKVAREHDSTSYASYLPPLHSLSTDPTAHLTFLNSLLERIPTEKSPDAHVLLLANIAHAKLLYGDVEGTKSEMDAAWKILDGLPSVENRVRADYYKVAADYYKVRSQRPLMYAPLTVERRPKPTTRRITETLCSTLLALKSRPWKSRNGCSERTT